MKNMARRLLGSRGKRVVRELLGKTARHRVEVMVPYEIIGPPDGSWPVATDRMPSGGVIYSLGIGDDIGFDEAAIARFGAQVWAFDPTPESLDWLAKQTLPPQLHVATYGISDFDGTAVFRQHDGVQYTMVPASQGDTDGLPVRTLRTVMKEFGHSHIDMLKINIEGGEYAVLDHMLQSTIAPSQIAVEFHHRFPGYRLQQTIDMVARLRRAGYKIFFIAENGKEYGFVR